MLERVAWSQRLRQPAGAAFAYATGIIARFNGLLYNCSILTPESQPTGIANTVSKPAGFMSDKLSPARRAVLARLPVLCTFVLKVLEIARVDLCQPPGSINSKLVCMALQPHQLRCRPLLAGTGVEPQPVKCTPYITPTHNQIDHTFLQVEFFRSNLQVAPSAADRVITERIHELPHTWWRTGTQLTFPRHVRPEFVIRTVRHTRLVPALHNS